MLPWQPVFNPINILPCLICAGSSAHFFCLNPGCDRRCINKVKLKFEKKKNTAQFASVLDVI